VISEFPVPQGRDKPARQCQRAYRLSFSIIVNNGVYKALTIESAIKSTLKAMKEVSARLSFLSRIKNL
jgi:hypothetical protein